MSGHSQLRSGNANWLLQKPNLMRELPHPDKRWEHTDVELSVGEIRSAEIHGLVESVGRHNDRNIWSTKWKAWDWLEDQEIPERPGECGHSGVRTIEAGEVYSCSNPECEIRFGREIAEKRLS